MKNYINLILTFVGQKEEFYYYVNNSLINLTGNVDVQVTSYLKESDLQRTVEFSAKSIEGRELSIYDITNMLEGDLRVINYKVTYSPMLDEPFLGEIPERLKDDPINELIQIIRPISDSLRRKYES